MFLNDMTPLRIIHLITELNVGGAEEMLHKVVTRMDPEGFRNTVVSMTSKGPVGERLVADGIPVFELGMALGSPSLKGFGKLHRLLKREPVDILQTWLYHADLLGFVAGKLAGIESIVWGIRCSDMDLRDYRPLTGLTVRVNGLLSHLVDAIVVNSREGMKVHRDRGYCSKRMVFIPNGFDLDRFRPDASARQRVLKELDLPDEVVLVGLVARFDPMKDHRTFFRAASILAAGNNSVHFVLIGKGMNQGNPQLMRLIGETLRNRVHLLGPRTDIPRLTAAFDMATSSSAYGEGFSNAIGEAMACGIPCVVTDVGDTASILGDTGLVIPPYSPEAMAVAWERLLKLGRNGREVLGQKARHRIMKNFEIGYVVKEFERLYKALRDVGGSGEEVGMNCYRGAPI